METKTPIEILNNLAKENGEIDFYNLLNNACWHNDYTEKKDLIKNVEKAMQLYAEQYAYQKCEEQKQNSIDRIPSYNQGRSGCTYGDTEYDSESVVFGYNMALDHCKENISKSYNVCNSKNK